MDSGWTLRIPCTQVAAPIAAALAPFDSRNPGVIILAAVTDETSTAAVTKAPVRGTVKTPILSSGSFAPPRSLRRGSEGEGRGPGVRASSAVVKAIIISNQLWVQDGSPSTSPSNLGEILTTTRRVGRLLFPQLS